MERDARFLVDLLRDRHPVVRELGQHYLVDTSVLNAAIELAGDISNQHILEIGCGPGSLTHHLLHAGARVSAIEIDEGNRERRGRTGNRTRRHVSGQRSGVGNFQRPRRRSRPRREQAYLELR